MDVLSVQSSTQTASAYTGNVKHRNGGIAEQQPTGTPPADRLRQTEQSPVFSTDEQQFFEGLYPGSGTDVRNHQAYSVKGEQRTSAPLGTMVDRKG